MKQDELATLISGHALGDGGLNLAFSSDKWPPALILPPEGVELGKLDDFVENVLICGLGYAGVKEALDPFFKTIPHLNGLYLTRFEVDLNDSGRNAFFVGFQLRDAWTIISDSVLPNIPALVISDPGFTIGSAGCDSGYMVDIYGMLEIFGAAVQVMVQWPAMIITGTLVREFDLQKLLAEAGFAEHVTFGDESAGLKIRAMMLRMDLNNKAFDFTFGMSGWQILPDDKLTLNNLLLDLSTSSEHKSAGVRAQMTVCGIGIDLSGAFRDGQTIFSGSTGTGQNIPIGKLLEDLAGKFGVTKPELPSALVDLTVKNLSVSFNTQRKDFKFTCEADLPTSAQSSLVIELVIDVKHDDQGACQFELSGQFDVQMDSATKLEFKLQFEHGGKTDKLIAAYHHEGKLPLNVSALLKALTPGDNDLTDLITGLDVAVDLKDVQLAFYKESAESSKPEKSLFGMLLNAEVSFSDPASHTNEKLVAELNSVLFASFERASVKLSDGQKATSKFLFGLKIGAELSVASLPLIGKDLPLEQPVGVKDLQLFVASQAILADDMEQVNNLLGADKIPSPMKEEDAVPSENVLEYGVTLNATLLLGAGSRTLVLAPSGSKSPAGEGLQNENTAESNRSIMSGTNQPEGQGTAPTALVTSQAPTPSVKWIKIEKSFGPIRFDRIGFQFQDQVIWFMLDASLAAAGLTLSFDGLGLGSTITKFEPQFDLRGLGIDYRNGPLEIGGAFLKQEFTTGNTKYTAFGGLAVIRTETLSISAIGSYANLNSCSSLFIYAVLDYPLGGPPFFYVTGLAAGFGYNRRLTLPTVDNIATFPLVEEATREGGPPQLPAGKDAQQETLTQELTKLENYIPSAAGQNFLVAGVKFTSFKMIDSFALLAVSFGEHLEIDILGISTIKVPFSEDKKAHCLAEIQIAFKASFIPAEGFLGVIAQLTSSSYILSKDCQLTGGMAFYSWFSGKHAGDFVLTVGGYHSKFKVPAHYPQVPALAINWQVSSNLSIKGDAYFALTPSALMAGGHLAATWHSGPIKAWFTAGADFLIAWKPFHYDATINVGMGVSYTYWFFGTRHITVELGADLHIWGPEFSGVARIHLWIISFDISFGAPASPTPEKIEWPEFQASFLPEQILTVSVKNGLISASSSSDNLGVVNPKDFSLVVDSFIPVRNLNGVAATYQDQVSGAQVPGANFGIAPMSMSDLATDLKISLTEGGKPCKDEQGKDRFKLISVTKNVPAGLWGAKLPLDLDSDSLVKDVISGVEIVPACQPEPVGKKEMDALDLQSTSEIKELHGQGKMDFLLLVDRSKVDQSQDTTRRQVIQDSLRRPNQKRQMMLEDLGLKDVKITISEQIADVFMVAPQIEQ